MARLGGRQPSGSGALRRMVALRGTLVCHLEKTAARNLALRRPRRGWLTRDWLGRLLAVAATAAMSGCAVGPDFLVPPAPDVGGYTPKALPAQTAAAGDAAGGSQRFVIGRDLPGDWWRMFGSPELKSLVERAVQNNPDLAAAQAALSSRPLRNKERARSPEPAAGSRPARCARSRPVAIGAESASAQSPSARPCLACRAGTSRRFRLFTARSGRAARR